MVEHPHHRYRFIEKAREKAQQEMEPFRFLQEAGEEINRMLKQSEEKAFRLAAGCAIACLLCFVILAISDRSDADLASVLLRPEPGEAEKQAEVIVTLSYEDGSLEESFSLSVPPRDLTKDEADAVFARCEAKILAQLEEACAEDGRLAQDLRLPQSSSDGMVAIVWSSSDPQRIAEDGKVNLIGATDEETVSLTASLSAGAHSKELVFEKRLASFAQDEWQSSLKQEAEALIQGLPQSLTTSAQHLPEQSAFGAKADWRLQKKGLPFEILGLCLFVEVLIVFSRTDALKRHLRKQKNAFEQEIPNMTMQMILLLDAGLTVEPAFSRLIEENRNKNHPLYLAFSNLLEESRSTNMPFVNLLYVYARQSGIRDLIRFASLALDCSAKGSELAEKLDKERQLLWNSRVNTAKSKAKEAETKLCFPLMLLLIAMMTIAIAPVLLEI